MKTNSFGGSLRVFLMLVSSRVLMSGAVGSNFITFGQVLIFFLPNRIFLINTLSIGFAATHRLRGTTHTESRDVLVNGFGLFWNVLLIKSSMQTALLRCDCLFLFFEDRGQFQCKQHSSDVVAFSFSSKIEASRVRIRCA